MIGSPRGPLTCPSGVERGIDTWGPDSTPKWVRLAPKLEKFGDFWGFFSFQIRFSTNRTESDLKKKSRIKICPIWGQSDSLWARIRPPWIDTCRCRVYARCSRVLFLFADLDFTVSIFFRVYLTGFPLLKLVDHWW